MTRHRTKTVLLCFVVVFLAFAAVAEARSNRRVRRRVRQRQQATQQTATQTTTTPLQDRLRELPGASHFTRNGKLHIAVRHGDAANTQLMNMPNTVEFFVKKGYMHLFVRVKDTTYDRHTSVKSSSWDQFQYKTIEQSGVLLELPKPLYQQLTKHLADAERDSRGTVGTFTMEGGHYPEQSNCTSWVALAKMGDKKLVEALGLPRGAKGIGDANPTRHPQSWVNALIDHSPFAKAVIMRNHEKTSAAEAKIDFTTGNRTLIR